MSAPARFTYFETLLGFRVADRRFKSDASYMVMHAYFDESGTHGADSPATIVAGLGATAAQLVGMEKRLSKLFADFGVGTFHAKDVRGTKGDFKGWESGAKAKFNSRFLQILDNQMAFGAAGIVAPEDYRKHYRDKPFPKRVRPDTEYGLCFRITLGRSMLFLRDRPRADWPLNVVLELGHKNQHDAVRIFEEVKSLPQNAGLLGTVSLASKSDCLFLAVADSLAYSLFRTTAGYTKHPTDPTAVPVGVCDPPYYVHKVPTKKITLRKNDLERFYKDHCQKGSSLRRLR
jgi:hypothetical protein